MFNGMVAWGSSTSLELSGLSEVGKLPLLDTGGSGDVVDGNSGVVAALLFGFNRTSPSCLSWYSIWGSSSVYSASSLLIASLSPNMGISVVVFCSSFSSNCSGSSCLFETIGADAIGGVEVEESGVVELFVFFLFFII